MKVLGTINLTVGCKPQSIETYKCNSTTLSDTSDDLLHILADLQPCKFVRSFLKMQSVKKQQSSYIFPTRGLSLDLIKNSVQSTHTFHVPTMLKQATSSLQYVLENDIQNTNNGRSSLLMKQTGLSYLLTLDRRIQDCLKI